MVKTEQETKLNIPTRLAIRSLHLYQFFISPLIGPSCRFYPSCSQYSIQAFTRFGGLKGLLLSIKRLSKCHPGNPGGIDELDQEITPKKRQTV